MSEVIDFASKTANDTPQPEAKQPAHEFFIRLKSAASDQEPEVVNVTGYMSVGVPYIAVVDGQDLLLYITTSDNILDIRKGEAVQLAEAA